MQDRETLGKLLLSDTVTSSLKQASSAEQAIKALQTVLHWLGFDKELNWVTYGADGAYGNSTRAAVAAFASLNGSTAKGSRVTQSLLRKILDRYDILEELKQLAEDLDKNRIEKHYRFRGNDKVRIASLQTLLNESGFGQELKWDKYGADGDYGRLTVAAAAAFAKKQGDNSKGYILTTQLARIIVDQISSLLGNDWKTPAPVGSLIADKLEIKTVLGNNNRQFVKVSNGISSKQFGKFRKGLFTYGNHKPLEFMQSRAGDLSALRLSRSEINVMVAVAENEGRLDAINTWDNAFLSFGMFQWTAGAAGSRGELPALLARIKKENSDLFEKYFGRHDLSVSDISSGLTHGRFSIIGNKLKTAAAKEVLRKANWAFIFWFAGQDPAIQAIEVKHAVRRLDHFYSTDHYKVTNRYKVSDLVTSEYGVGLILDNHVNRPAYVQHCLAKALEKTQLDHPEEWGTSEENRLIEAYLDIRTNYGSSPMTDAEKRARVTRKYLNNGTISDVRGSFRRN
jgi:peptidoglycan hydrolase-like protein with peptidoglycan-binding domain